MNRREDGDNRRDGFLTGHDRFCQERPKTRRKRRPPTRRVQSAIELDTEAMLSARAGALDRRGRSASIDDDESEEEKGYQLTTKIDSLAKILFNRVTAARNREQNEMRQVIRIMILEFQNKTGRKTLSKFTVQKFVSTTVHAIMFEELQ